MALYYITGIWFTETSTHKYVSEVLLHETSNNGNTFHTGVKTSKDAVIKKIQIGDLIKTLIWNYQTKQWGLGSSVGWETINNIQVLRTIKDGKKVDNLDNLINYQGVFSF